MFHFPGDFFRARENQNFYRDGGRVKPREVGIAQYLNLVIFLGARGACGRVECPHLDEENKLALEAELETSLAIGTLAEHVILNTASAARAKATAHPG
jgi:hypothetical protein